MTIVQTEQEPRKKLLGEEKMDEFLEKIELQTEWGHGEGLQVPIPISELLPSTSCI